jgi:hypothetical protein
MGLTIKKRSAIAIIGGIETGLRPAGTNRYFYQFPLCRFAETISATEEMCHETISRPHSHC